MNSKSDTVQAVSKINPLDSYLNADQEGKHHGNEIELEELNLGDHSVILASDLNLDSPAENLGQLSDDVVFNLTSLPNDFFNDQNENHDQVQDSYGEIIDKLGKPNVPQATGAKGRVFVSITNSNIAKTIGGSKTNHLKEQELTVETDTDNE